MSACVTCYYAVPVGERYVEDSDPPEYRPELYCHRYPPVQPSNRTGPVWLEVEPDDWCGEYKEEMDRLKLARLKGIS